MKIVDEFNYRNAKEILAKAYPQILEEIYSILNDEKHVIDLSITVSQRKLSRQIQGWFANSGWKMEQSCFSIASLKYDLLKGNIPIEIEIGHKRLVYADFFEFMADYSKCHIPLGIMIVAGDSKKFGHIWHNSMSSTMSKIESI